jgi:glycosyltransferase involved in cell wall biosynthesis
MARPRVLVDARFVSAAPTSSHARYLRGLAGAWARDGGDLDIVLFAPGPLPPELPKGPRLHWVAAPRIISGVGRRAAGGRVWLNTIFTFAAARFQPSVIFFPYPFVPRVVAAPAVVTMHDICFSSRVDQQPDGGGSLDYRARQAVRAASALIAVSSSTKIAVTATYGVDPCRISVVHHGIAPMFTEQETPEDSTLRDDYGLQRRGYFLCVSTHEPRKNLETLATAFVEMARCRSASPSESGEPPLLVLIGRRSSYSARIDEIFARDAQASRQLRMLDSVSDQHLAALYRGAMAVVYPSMCEGFGFPVVEALACGSPVLASDQPLFRELVGDAPVYIAPRDSLAWAREMSNLLADPGPRTAAQAIAPSIREQFTWDAAGRATRAVLERAASRS